MDYDDITFISPLEDRHFFNLVISSKRKNWKPFQQTFDYNLEIQEHDRNISLFHLIRNNISLFSINVRNNYENLKNSKFSNIIDDIIYKWNLNEMDFNKAYNLYVKNREYFDKYFNYYHSDWFYLNSKKTNPTLEEKIEKEDITQRLYITINSDQIDFFCKDFQNILESQNLPYNFKFHHGKIRSADTICIYSDNVDRTLRYIYFLLDMIKNNQNYKNAIHRPQAHLGIINDLIGFGFEFRNGCSYSQVMEDISYEALSRSFIELYNIETNKNNRLLDLFIKKVFYINFRHIFNSKYPDYDIDMEDIRIRLQRKSFVNMQK